MLYYLKIIIQIRHSYQLNLVATSILQVGLFTFSLILAGDNDGFLRFLSFWCSYSFYNCLATENISRLINVLHEFSGDLPELACLFFNLKVTPLHFLERLSNFESRNGSF